MCYTLLAVNSSREIEAHSRSPLSVNDLGKEAVFQLRAIRFIRCCTQKFYKANVVNTSLSLSHSQSTREQADMSDTIPLPFRHRLQSKMTAPLLSLKQHHCQKLADQLLVQTAMGRVAYQQSL